MTFRVSGTGIAIGTAAAVGLFLFAKREIRTAFKAVDPTDRDNLVNSGVNKVGAALTGRDSFSLGASLFEFFNPSAVEREREIASGTVTRDDLTTGVWFGPVGNNGQYEPPPDDDLRQLGTSRPPLRR